MLEKRQVFQQLLLGKLDIHMYKTEIILYPKTNSKWINDDLKLNKT
jgi:hypothetical protein